MKLLNMRVSVLLSLLLLSPLSFGVGMQDKLESTKSSQARLNATLMGLEEALLYPDKGQLSVFVGINQGEFFAPERLDVYVNDQLVSQVEYDEDMRYALSRGGIQRVYTGNHSAGEHEIKTFFVGMGKYSRTLKRGASIHVEKDKETPAYVQLNVTDSSNDYRSNFDMVEAEKEVLYGEALYHYFLGDHFQALSQLYYAQEKGATADLGAEPLILEGGLHVSLAMSGTAEDIFKKVLEEAHNQQAKDKARYYLSKLYYQQGQWKNAYATIKKIKGQFSEGLKPAYQDLKVKLHLYFDEIEQAAQLANQISGDSLYKAYAKYNVGVALTETTTVYDDKRFEQIEDAFESVIKHAGQGEEGQALKDKARFKLGLAGYLFANNSRQKDKVEGYLEDATAQIKQVDVTGLEGQSALLLYGRLLDKQGQTERALGVWQYLMDQELDTAEKVEAQMLYAQSLSLLGAPAQALSSFDNADDYLSSAIKRRQGIEKGLKADKGAYYKELLDPQAENKVGWFAQIKQQYPQGDITQQLNYYLGSHSFQEQFKHYRDLAYIQDLDRNWSNKLQVYRGKIKDKGYLTDSQNKAFAKAKQQKRLKWFTKALNRRFDQLYKARKALSKTLGQHKKYMTAQVDLEMKEQVANIGIYMAKSRLAVARIYDEAMKEADKPKMAGGQ